MGRLVKLLAGFSLIALHVATFGCTMLQKSAYHPFSETPFSEKEGDAKLKAVEEPQSITGFPDLPIPKKFKFNRGKSFIYEAGSGTVKVGHLFFSGWSSLGKVIPFYQNEMINKGWSLVQFVERDISTLHYQKEGLDCRVTIASSLGKTEIEIVIGPK